MLILAPETIDLSQLPFVPLTSRSQLPNIAGIYFVVSDDSDVPLYIGQGKSLHGRWLCHNKIHHFTGENIKIAWIVLEHTAERLIAEKACIFHWKPRFNRRVVPLVKPRARQTSVRITPEVLRLAKYYLDKEDSNLQEFLSEQLERYVAQRAQGKQHPDALAASTS